MSCCLTNLPLTSDPLCGLLLEADTTLRADPDHFPCCKGEGWQYDMQVDAVRRCGLLERVGKVQHLLAHPYAPSKFPKHATLPALLAIARAQHGMSFPRGKLSWKKTPLSFHAASKPMPPSVTASLGFSFALACLWQLGLSAMWVPLGENLGETLPIWLSQQETPDVCWVEQRKPMWQRQTREDFAALIHWCDAAAVPLWAELYPAPSLTPQLRRRTVAVDQILNQAKSRPTLEWLDAHSQSRLGMIMGR